MNKPVGPEKAIELSQEKFDKAVSSARKLIGVLGSEIKNPLSKKPLRYAVVFGGVTYFAYLYLRKHSNEAPTGETVVEGEYQAGAVIDGQRIELGGDFTGVEVVDEDGVSQLTLEPNVAPGWLSDEDVNKLDQAVSAAEIEPILETPASDE